LLSKVLGGSVLGFLTTTEEDPHDDLAASTALQERLGDRPFVFTGGAWGYIADGGNHMALVHRRDVARLYVLALGAPAVLEYLAGSAVRA